MVADYLNSLSDAIARAALTRCCGAARWVERLVAARPFASDAALFAAAERAWWALGPEDWREAFAGHPRLGTRGGDKGGEWSRREQAGLDGASAATRRALAEANRAYEERFGHVFLLCATGKSAADMLAELTRRLTNDPAQELRIAAGEQAKITRLRLEKLVTS